MADQSSRSRPGSSSGGGTTKERIGTSVPGLCTTAQFYILIRMLQFCPFFYPFSQF